jgi:hypothetical protein
MNGPDFGIPTVARESHPMLERAWNILVSPREEWARIAGEGAPRRGAASGPRHCWALSSACC